MECWRIRTRLVTVGSCRATAMRWPSRVLVLNSLSLTLVARVHSCNDSEYEKLLALGRSFTSEITICQSTTHHAHTVSRQHSSWIYSNLAQRQTNRLTNRPWTVAAVASRCHRAHYKQAWRHRHNEKHIMQDNATYQGSIESTHLCIYTALSQQPNYYTLYS